VICVPSAVSWSSQCATRTRIDRVPVAGLVGRSGGGDSDAPQSLERGEESVDGVGGEAERESPSGGHHHGTTR
jgi:hypothetical protein